MASQHIEIPGTASRLSANIRADIDTLQRVVKNLTTDKQIAEQIASGDDYTALAAALGLATPSDAQTFYNMLVDANTALAAYAISALLNRAG